jgi:hypothetical protein
MQIAIGLLYDVEAIGQQGGGEHRVDSWMMSAYREDASGPSDGTERETRASPTEEFQRERLNIKHTEEAE